MQVDSKQKFIAQARRVVSENYWKLPLPDSLEQSYQEFYHEKRRKYYLVTTVMGSLFYALYTLVDFVLLRETYHLAFLIRFGLVIPIVLIAIASLSLLNNRKLTDDGLIAVGAATVCASILYIEYMAFAQGIRFYNTGILIVIAYFNIIVRINFKTSLIVTLFAVIGTLIMFYRMGISNEQFALMLLDHTAMAVLSLSANYYIQLQHRKAYIRNYLLEYSKQKITASELRLKKIVDMDSLTGVGNRRMLNKLKDACQSESRGVLFIDIDYFKKFNDLYGHAEGDESLISVADIIVASIRENDKCVRYGGEEFIVCLDGLPEQQVKDIAERIRRDVEAAKITHQGSSHGQLTVSIGIDYTMDPDKTLDEMLEAADQALYQAKQSGRNQTQLAA